ncbi:hypothetical protein AgCh_006103 [Apium graveolens]
MSLRGDAIRQDAICQAGANKVMPLTTRLRSAHPKSHSLSSENIRERYEVGIKIAKRTLLRAKNYSDLMPYPELAKTTELRTLTPDFNTLPLFGHPCSSYKSGRSVVPARTHRLAWRGYHMHPLFRKPTGSLAPRQRLVPNSKFHLELVVNYSYSSSSPLMGLSAKRRSLLLLVEAVLLVPPAGFRASGSGHTIRVLGPGPESQRAIRGHRPTDENRLTTGEASEPVTDRVAVDPVVSHVLLDPPLIYQWKDLHVWRDKESSAGHLGNTLDDKTCYLTTEHMSAAGTGSTENVGYALLEELGLAGKNDSIGLCDED